MGVFAMILKEDKQLDYSYPEVRNKCIFDILLKYCEGAPPVTFNPLCLAPNLVVHDL